MSAGGDSDLERLEGSTLAGRYRVEARLGEGGMGAVYRAHDLEADEAVAMKVLHPELASVPEIIERFRREAQAATSIGHEHIIDVSDWGTLPTGSPFMVMELLEGQTLGELLKHEPALSVRRAARIVRQVCAALGAAHQAGIVHRDMKPDNVFLIERGGEAFVKVLDFGISKIKELDEEGVKLTKAGTAVGTPSYMAPEQTQGLENVDHRADIYAVGVILYEVLCGEKPFKAASYAALLLKTVMESAPLVSQRRADVPPALTGLVHAALAKTPGERPVDMLAMAKALELFVDEPEAPPRWVGEPGGGSARERASRTSSEPTAIGRAETLTRDADTEPELD